MRGALERERGAHRESDRFAIRHRQRAREPDAGRADVRIRCVAKAGGAAAEHLAPGEELDVHLQADHRLPRHQRTSSVAGSARSTVIARLSIAASSKAGAMIWPPMGSPPSRPTGMLIAGKPT